MHGVVKLVCRGAATGVVVGMFIGAAARPGGTSPAQGSVLARSQGAQASLLQGGEVRVYLPALNPDPNAPPPRASQVLEVPGEYATIAAGLAAARAGDVVRVADGSYVESGLRVPASVSVEGAGWWDAHPTMTSIWNGDGAPFTVALDPGARIEGVNIASDEANREAVGILIEGAGRRTIRNVAIEQHGTAISARCAAADCGQVLDVRHSLLFPNRRGTVGIDADAGSGVLVDHVNIVGASTGVKLHGAGSQVTNSILWLFGIGSAGVDGREAGELVAHHNLFADVETPYVGLEPGEGDVFAYPLLAPMEPMAWKPTALSPARGAADDGSDLGAVPFAAFGEPPSGLRVERGDPPSDGTPAQWVLAFEPVPDAYINHAYATPSDGGPTVLHYAYADPTVHGGGPRVVLYGLEPGRTYDLTASTVYADRGESEAADPITFVVPPLATVLEDDDPTLVATGTWQPVTAAGASGGRYIATSTKGDTLAFTFSGDSVALRRVLGPDGGQANVQIDGRSQGVLEFYFHEPRVSIPAVYDGLGDGPHTLVLRVLSTAQSASRGKRVTFDRADTPSGHVPDAIQRAAHARVNAIRTAAGLGEVHQAGALDLASAAHAAWDMANGFAKGHVETPGTPGFTGARSWDRASYFGYTPHVGEDMAFEWGTAYTPDDAHYGPAAVDAWQATVYHRNLIMEYSHVDMGFGYAFEEDKAVGVLLMGARGGDGPLPATRYAYTWPVDGATDVPRSWDGIEGPDPLPQRDDDVGYPASLYLAQPQEAVAAALAVGASDVDGIDLRLGIRPARPDQSTPWRVTRAELRDAAGALVRAYAIDQRNDAPRFLGPDVVFLIAEQPMAARARYEARVSGTDSRGVAFDVTWGFTTGE